MSDIALKYPLWQNQYLQAMAENRPELLKSKISAAEQVGRRFRKGAGETHPLSEFLVGLWLWLLSRRRGEHEH